MLRRVGIVAVLASILFTTADQSAVAQVPGSERCSDQAIVRGFERARQIPNPPQVLFDGKAALAKPPSRQIAIPAQATPAVPACVVLSVTFTEQGGALYVEQSGYIAAAGQGMLVRGRGAALHEAGTRVLREMMQQELLPTRPRPGVRYLVAVPIAADHPLYRTPPAAAVAKADDAGQRSAPPTLAGHGYRDARFLRTADGAQVHLIAERGDQYWFALVRSIRADEPVLDFAGDPASPGTMIAGERTTQRFHRLIAPNVRDTGALRVTVEVRHYAVGTKIAHQPNSRYVHNNVRRHPLLEHAVDVPVAVEYWTGERRSPAGPFTWSTHTSYPGLNTIAAIQAAQEEAGARMESRASAQAARDAEEIMWVRAARARMEERERLKPARYAAKRLTYQPPAYWSAFAMGHDLRRVYDGYYPDARRDWVFGRIYFYAVATYGDTCRDLLPSGSAKQTTTWYHNDITGKIPGEVEEIYVHRDYVPVFRAWYEGRSDTLVRNPDEVSPAAVLSNPGTAMAAGFEVHRVKIALRDDMRKLFATPSPCRSGVIVQFMENLKRLGNGESTLQAERVPDTLAGPGDAPTTIGEACDKYDRNNGHRRNSVWCLCLDRVLTPRYSATDLPKVLESYTAFMERVSRRWSGDILDEVPPESIAADACRK
ncbi:MAG: hypothetical protein KIS79_04030 [Burkholderiales bacterium]|nr:hypothetical protein [Burkholderiales bacterium]